MAKAPSEIEEEPQYDVVLKMVLWGDSREAVMHRLKVNGVEASVAERIYKAARKVRLQTIREEAAHAVKMGVFWLVVGVVGFSVLDLGDHLMGKAPIGLAAMSFGVAAWKLFNGISTMILADKKTGPVND